jgi:type I restriction enzyme S subunit
MPKNRSIVSVAELINHRKLVVGDGYRAKNSELAPTGIPFARGQNINNGFLFDTADRFPEKDLNKVGDKVSRPGDVVFTSKGTVGRFAYVRQDTPRFVYSPQLCFWRSLDYEKIEPKWLFYWMQSQEFFAQYKAVAGQTDMADYVSLRDQRQFRIALPTINEQRAIAAVLGALDDKIELNRQMNRTLEAMARALFKSWFVDFDPVLAKVEGQPSNLPPDLDALFPDSFEDSELGEIPAGWKVGSFSDICEPTIGGDWGKDEVFSGAVETICLRGVDLERLRNGGWSDAPKRFIKENSLVRRQLTECDILVAASGVGPLGRSLWAAPALQSVYGQPVVYSNFCKRFRAKSPAIAVFIDRVLLNMRESEEIWKYASGTSIPNLNQDALLTMHPIVIPFVQIMERFYELVKPNYDKLFNLETLTLAAIRDTLLPKLLSGEIRVPEAEKVISHAL